MKCNISIVLINPWITDFAAYNLWAEPLGLLYVASILKAAGASIHYVDCLSSSRRPNPSVKPTGCSKYHRRLIEKPEPLTFIKRNYAVYGINESEFLESLGKIPRPDAILVTSHMTYWYPGVFRAIELATGYYGKSVPVILGGIYAKLCTLHAEGFSGASCVFTAQDLYDLLPLVERLTRKTFQRKPSVKDFSRYPLPLHELGAKKNFFCVLTSRGCPFSCSYCASPLLWKNFCKREYSSVVEEIETYTALLGTKNVAFYDDALLVDAEHHILPILKKYSGNPKKIFFHLPNGIHARLRAAGHLRSAGYNRKEVGTYIIAGLPGQTPEDVESSIEFVYRAGAAPYLSYFSPIPGTAIWQEASKRSPFPVEREPLFQNNSVFLLGNSGFSSASVQHLRDMAVGLRNSQ